MTLGKYPDMTIEQARHEAQRVITEMLKGKNPNEEKKKLRAETTFGEMFTLIWKDDTVSIIRKPGKMMSGIYLAS